MQILANIFVALVALIHIYILTLEMFFWTKPRGLKIFRQSLEKAQESAVLAANQGLYNGFWAAGLAWGLIEDDYNFARAIKLFFLVCVAVAGMYGAWTTKNKKILFVQTGPAAIALALVLFA